MGKIVHGNDVVQVVFEVTVVVVSALPLDEVRRRDRIADVDAELEGVGAFDPVDHVKVVDVLPNQQLVIEGTRQTSFAGESQDIVLRGTVRTDDIAANNTVFSYNVADAKITFVNKGAVTDSQRKGWFTKIWEVLTPF